jgi:hypothetical protein
MKRFQECNWIVKLWRLRHYVYIPFRFIGYKLRGGVDIIPNNKTLWNVLIGSAQCDMNWTYTSEEVWDYINKKKDEQSN